MTASAVSVGAAAPAGVAEVPVAPVRLLRIIARLNVGGPAIQATILGDRLDSRRYECRLSTGTADRREGDYLSLHGKTIPGLEVVPGLGREIRGWDDARALAALVGRIRRFRPHIVHTHTAKAGVLGRLAAWLCGVPVIVHTYHGHVFHGYFSARQERRYASIERWLARRTDRLITVSRTVRDELLGLGIGSPDQHVVVPLGLDLERFLHGEHRRGELRGELGVSRDARLVGIVARLVPIKAHDVFLQAAAALADRMPDVTFLIVGDGERREELEGVAEALGVRSRVRFLGWRSDLDRVYADLDVVTLTSRNEGSPVALIEAMAAGRAVVATSVGGVPDLVQDGVNGLLVPPDDPVALSNALTALLDDSERRRTLGAQGRERTRTTFGADRLVADLDRLYQELLDGSGGRG